MTELAHYIVATILLVPIGAAAILAALPGYRPGARVNVIASFLTFAVSLGLFHTAPKPGLFLMVDDFNIYLIVLTTFIGFTASAFSASYIGHELETGRLTPTFLRFYHAMYHDGGD